MSQICRICCPWRKESVEDEEPLTRTLNRPQPDHVRALTRYRKQLVDSLTRVEDITEAISQLCDVSDADCYAILRDERRDMLAAASEKLVSLLIRKPVDVYECFLNQLKLTRQIHLFDLLTHSDESVRLDVCHSTIIRESYTFLTANLTVSADLLAQTEILNNRELENIQSGRTNEHKVHRLLYFISRKSRNDFTSFVSSLRRSQQEHVAEKLVTSMNRFCEQQSTTVSGDTGFATNISKKAKNLTLLDFTSSILEIILLKVVLMRQQVGASSTNAVSGGSENVVTRSTDALAMLLSVCSTWRLTWRPWCARVILLRIAESQLDIRLELTTRIETGCVLIGVTRLHNRIYVIFWESKIIRVYDANTFERLEDIKVQKGWHFHLPTKTRKSVQAYDVVASVSQNCLYVSDYNNSCVWVVYEGGLKIKKWLKTEPESHTLSVTTDGRLLMLSDEPPRLYIYAVDGKLMIIVKLPNDMVEPQHAVETNTGHFIVSHGIKDSPVHRVCKMTRDGRVIQAYGNLRGDRLDQFNGPGHLVIDVTGRVYVADCFNCRLVVLDPALRVAKVVKTWKRREHCPLRLWYHANSNCGEKSTGELEDVKRIDGGNELGAGIGGGQILVGLLHNDLDVFCIKVNVELSRK